MFLKVSLLVGMAMIAMNALGQQAAPAPAARAARVTPTFPPLFIAEEWTRPANAKGQVPVAGSNVSHQNLELKVYGTDAKNLTISGEAGNATGRPSGLEWHHAPPSKQKQSSGNFSVPHCHGYSRVILASTFARPAIPVGHMDEPNHTQPMSSCWISLSSADEARSAGSRRRHARNASG